MFAWYLTSDICYVYLDDIEISKGQSTSVSTQQLRNSTWITRGWTLQELIAPDRVQFFSSDWIECGTRSTLAQSLFEITNIDLDILQRMPRANEHEWLYSLSVSKRMSWAAARETTRPEDTAYCLLGIFNVNMTMLYGEGLTKAFHRLQEEIMKYSTDQTILAWDPSVKDKSSTMGVLADSPSAFKDGSRIEVYEHKEQFEMTNKGLRIAPHLYGVQSVFPDDAQYTKKMKVAALNCFYVDDPSGQIGIVITADDDTASVYSRVMLGPEVIAAKFLMASHEQDKRVEFAHHRHMQEMGYVYEKNMFRGVDSGLSLIRDRIQNIEGYLQNQEQRIGSIYITHILARGRREHSKAITFYIKPIKLHEVKRGGVFSLYCSSVGPRSLDTAENEGGYINANQPTVEICLLERLDATGSPDSLCRFIISRSDSNPMRLQIAEVHCHCNDSCPRSSEGLRDLRCSNYGFSVKVKFAIERVRGVEYNNILFEVWKDGRRRENMKSKGFASKALNFNFKLKNKDP